MADPAAPVEGLNFIGGEWAAAGSGKLFERRNPANLDERIGSFPDSARADMDAAVDFVAAGFDEWAELPAERRAQVLDRAAAWLEERREQLTDELVREEGKTRAEASVETTRTPQNLRFFAGEALRVKGETAPYGRTGLVYTYRAPVGVVGVITPWNFPLNIPSRKIGPALAAGNGVVFKPSPVTPLLAQRLVEALLAAGVPSGALALVHGGGEPGQALVAHPRTAAVTFTGSYPVGEAIHAAASPTRRTQLEMGGKNPTVILEDADLDRAAQIVFKGAFGLTGQACTGTSRVIAVDAVHDAVVERVVDLLTKQRIGNGLDPDVTMGPIAADFQLDKVLEYVETGRRDGAQLVYGGERLTGGEFDRGYFFRPAVFTELQRSPGLSREEVFGPVLGFQRAGTLDEAIDIANDTDYGLSAGIVTRDIGRALLFARRMESGLGKINEPTTGMSMTAPFGGLKRSSTQTFKEQAGATMMHFYTQEKTVYVAG